MPDKEKAKKLAAAKKKLKEYQTKEKHLADVDSSDASEYGGNARKQDVRKISQPQLQYQKQEEVVNKNLDNEAINRKVQQHEETAVNGMDNIDPIQQHQQSVSQEAVSSSFSAYFNNIDPTQQHQQSVSQEAVSSSFSAYFNNMPSVQPFDLVIDPSTTSKETNLVAPSPTTSVTYDNLGQSSLSLSSEKSHVNAMEILIAEKAALTAELTKQQALCKEKTLESEELTVQLEISINRIKTLENEIKELHSQNSTLKMNLDELNKRFEGQKFEFDEQNLKCNELIEHLEELKRELNEENKKNEKLEQELKEKSCELELSQIRINQISDEANFQTDNRVELLTQTKFMYEQQISDLQAMVQQLTTERDQANQQYQNYVQHLNKEMTNISEKNSELNAENERLANRERTLIEHIGSLEKQIQENITKQENLKEKVNQQPLIENSISGTEKLELEKQIESIKIEKSKLENENQTNKNIIEEISLNLIEKDNKILELQEKINEILSDQPNNEKLLATIESDKVAASRALLQNEELKKQLNEVEQKLIQITNDKVELVELLDTERYTNRKIRENYNEMEKQLNELTEKLHFKDEEMIRLTHEHNELNKTILQLNQRLDRLMHYEAKEYIRQQKEIEDKTINQKWQKQQQQIQNEETSNDASNISNDNSKEMNCDHHHNEKHDTHQDNYHQHKDCNHDNSDEAESSEINHASPNEENARSCQLHSDLTMIRKEMPSENNCNHNIEFNSYPQEYSDEYTMNGIPTHEAMEKLQERFHKIMLEVADLTDEKQRLEHLVCQLQDETETIGEYITLYQTQRRLLKQREIEKTTQLRMLLNEREEMKEKITNLTQLVENLITGHNNEYSSVINSNSDNENKLFSTQHTESSAIEAKEISELGIINHEYTIDKSYDKIAESIVTNNIQQQQNNSLKQSTINNPILMKIHNIIAEIKEREDNFETNLKFIPSVDHCACCSGKFETV